MMVYKDRKPKVYKDQWSTRTKPHNGLQGPNNGGLQGPTKQYYLSADKQQTELGKAKYSKYTPKFPTLHFHNSGVHLCSSDGTGRVFFIADE